MPSIYQISSEDCKKLADKIKTDFYEPINEFKTTIFLCGAALDKEDKFRSQIWKLLTEDGYYSSNYNIILPEYLFADLLYDSKGGDLLSLENILANSVDVIIIVPESTGSIAELGAFVNEEKLREKIICVLDRKFKKDRSFIIKGPIELLKGTNKDAVIFADPDDLSKSIPKLNLVVKGIKNKSTKITNEINLLQLENFLLPSIFLLEPIEKGDLGTACRERY